MRRWRRPRGRASERGIAMVATLLVMMIVSTLLTVVTAEAMQALPLARHAQDYQAALQAADAGVEDYINRLDNNASYYLVTTDPNNPALTGWTPVPGSSVGEWFRYAVNSTDTARTGVVHLVVSGAAGTDPATSTNDFIRTIDVGISLSGFTSFLYYTDYEIVNPSIATVDGGNYSRECKFHAWQWNTYDNNGTYGPDPSCAPDFIYFTSGDVLNGPVFSNDAFHICGSPSFPQGATSAMDQSTQNDVSGSTQYGGAGYVYMDRSCGGNSPTFGGTGTQPAGAADSAFPATNTNLASDLGASNDGGGCSYTGPITVAFHSDGTMSVALDSSSSTATSPSSGVHCQGNNIALPPNGLLYDANPQGCGSSSCYANVYVSGTVNGQVTVGSQTNITVTGNLEDASTTGADVIGLSATNSIVLGAVDNLTIDAAMVALDNSIYLPSWSRAPSLGDLTVEGSLAQKFRGPVGTTAGNGFTKAYSWDSRLKYVQPPYFTSPTLPNWVKSSFAECNATPAPTATTC